ncbi:hypothetical protein BHU72_05525 [Desulfuribacillus stibiiarsenatis]|uniref:ABC transporter permease n=1 Tax=Desulfuribacillus stibiiarsenatis TaxID=1390249 RepID=A0A1E5L4N4_9FIRM|nr:ABC transporter permease subunit [Desulfuribacillus stibiiarsenatis]OEH85071.1 hypothetical protein BHU72_05525 [Desulfuribacillus stibiiarsenatis]
MSYPLLKSTIKSNWVIGIIILAVMFMYLAIILSMYDPEGNEALNALLATLPQELVKAMGYDTIETNLIGFVSSYYYGFIVILFPMIYSIIVANRLIAKHVDSGSMAYLLSTPNTRFTIVTTQAIYLLMSIAVIFTFITILGITIAQWLFAGELHVRAFIQMNVSAMLLFFAISGICFFFSCLFNDTKNSLAFGAGIPVAFFIINLLANVSPTLDWLQYLTIFTLFQPSTIIGDTFPIMPNIILIVIACACYAGGILLFRSRDLPL